MRKKECLIKKSEKKMFWSNLQLFKIFQQDNLGQRKVVIWKLVFNHLRKKIQVKWLKKSDTSMKDDKKSKSKINNFNSFECLSFFVLIIDFLVYFDFRIKDMKKNVLH